MLITCFTLTPNFILKCTPSFQVQHRVPLHDDVDADGAGLLPAPGLRREDRAGRHRPPRLLRLHAGHRGEDAGDLGVHPAHRYFDPTGLILLYPMVKKKKIVKLHDFNLH